MFQTLARPQRAALILLIVSAGALAFAYVAQYGFDLQPCALCLWQRWPFIAALPLAALVLLLGRAAGAQATAGILVLLALLFAANVAIAFFHVGVEQHWWAGTEACTGSLDAGGSVEDLKRQIMEAPLVRCDEVAWSFLGLSMAGWNMFLSLGLLLLSLWGARQALRGRA